MNRSDFMSIADVAASAVKSITKYNAKKLRKKRSAPQISVHNKKHISGEKYNVGFSSCEVMPDDLNTETYWIAGHGPGKKIEGVHDPITVRAMWIGCSDNGGILMVSADIIGLTNFELNLVRANLKDLMEESTEEI